MNNSYSVSSCTYDGSAPGDSNPMCAITGTVNGKRVFPRAFFQYLAAAKAAGQMQQALTAILFNWYASVYGYQLSPWPTPSSFPQFSPVNAAPTATTGPNPQPVVYSPALIDSWTA